MQLSLDLHFDAEKQLLKVNELNEIISLTFAETQILAALCQQQGQVVSKEQLIAAAWPDRVVGDSSLQNALSTLRRKLAPFSDIELKTLPRRGYALHLPQQQQKKWSWKLVAVVATLIILLLLIGLQFVLDRTPKNIFFEQQLASQLNGASGAMSVLRTQATPFSEKQLQQRINNQFVVESDWQSPFADYQGMALLANKGDSFTFCPNYKDGQCPGDKLISLFGDVEVGGQQELSEFLATKIRMEEKTYNSLQFDELGGDTSGMVEQLYFGDAYFKLNNHQLARSDMRISMVPTEKRGGLFYFAACVTDEDCYTTPLKYRIHGRYVETKERWDNRNVSRFTVSVESVELTSPNKLSEMAKQLYREFRKSELNRADLVFYRIYQDDDTAVWMIPFSNKTLVWMKQRELHL